MTLHFPAIRNKCDVSYAVDGNSVTVTEVQLNRRPSPLAYAAIGYEKEQGFYPTRTVTKAKLPLKLPLPQGKAKPVVHLVNAYGDQAFFTVD